MQIDGLCRLSHAQCQMNLEIQNKTMSYNGPIP